MYIYYYIYQYIQLYIKTMQVKMLQMLSYEIIPEKIKNKEEDIIEA